MNISTIKTALTQKTGRAGLYLQKHSPEILLGAGLIGGVVAAVMAAKATLKVDDILMSHEERMSTIEVGLEEHPLSYTEHDAMKDKAVVYVQTGMRIAKLYGPSVSLGFLSLAAILASHGVMRNRQVALVAAYNLLAEGFKSYRARVIEDLGEETDRNYFLGLKDENYTEHSIDEEGKKVKTKKTRKALYDHDFKSIYARFFDETNAQYRTDRTMNKAFLLAQQNYMNDVLIIRGHVFLNEVYQALGFPHTKEGAIVGWVLKDPKTMKEEGRDGHIDFGIFDVENDPGREFVNGTNPTILLDFNVDGIIFDLI